MSTGGEGTGTGGKTADGLTWADVDGLEWEEVDGLEWWIAPSSLHCHIRVTPALHACCISRPELSACIHATPAIHGEAVVQ